MSAWSKTKNKLLEGLCLLRVSSTARRVRQLGLTYLSPSKLLTLEQQALRIEHQAVPGDFCEFGLALGGSGIVLAKLLGPQRSFHGFDVFEMIPPPTSEKDDAHSLERYKTIADGKSIGIKGQTYYGYQKNLFEKANAHFRDFGVEAGARVQLHKGLFEETWPKLKDSVGNIALAHIDCDWYDPVTYCLAICKDRMPSGGVVIVDDYYAYKGARTATDEFVLSNQDFTLRDAGKHVILLRN
jgi:O-methyltransferase